MAFWRSGGDQGKCLRNDTIKRAFTISQNGVVYVQNFGAFSFLVCDACVFIDRMLFLDWTIQPYEAFQARARKDHASFSWFFDDLNVAGAATAAVEQDVAIVFLQSDSGEGYVTVDGNAGDR